MKKKILVLYGHPRPESYCKELADAYVNGARKSEAAVKYVSVRTLNFDFLSVEDRRGKPLEADLKKMQRLISWCDHLVLVYPVWWGSMPALMKGLLDRVITSGFAFRYRKDGFGWHRLLKGKSARVIMTTGGPWILNHWAYHGSHIAMIKWATLWFCGFGPIKISEFNSIDAKWMTSDKRKKKIVLAEKIGSYDACC